MARGWTWINEDSISEEDMEKRTPLLDDLARQWSALHDAEELQRFARQADMEDGYNDYEYEDDADEFRCQQLEQLRDRQHAAQVEVIQTAMEELGARMMRPYEHWNEDERYMQYMECDRFGDSCY
jgi:hypothetical protein